MQIKLSTKLEHVAGKKVIMHEGELEKNMTDVITLNPTSVWLYQKLFGQEFDTSTVVNLLRSKYEIPDDVAHDDAHAWISTLTNAGIIIP